MNEDVERNKMLMEQKSVQILALKEKDTKLNSVLDTLVQLESTLKFACSERSTLNHDSLSALNSLMSSQVKAKDARLTTAEGLVSHIYSFDKYLHSF
jgi:hypothetical protein